jgi:CheY-like chemotaxis protein
MPVPQILVAAGDPETRSYYSTVFGLAGCEVVEASDGRQALARALTQPPALVLTEIRLPFLDGCSLCEILRRDRATVNVPLLVITDERQPALVERARQTGDCVMFKPATPEAIVSEARRLLDASRGTHSSSAVVDEQSTASPLPAGHRPNTTTKARITQARALQRFSSKTPPTRPPALECPACDHRLVYELSHVGGVNNLHREQWDYFYCPSGCGTYQYRQRTRSIRRVE